MFPDRHNTQMLTKHGHGVLFAIPEVELINAHGCVLETPPTDVSQLLVLFRTNTTLERVIVFSLRVLFLA